MPREWTPEQQQAARDRMAKARAAKGNKQEDKELHKGVRALINADQNVLDLTEKIFNVEDELVRFILWEYDKGNKVDTIKMTSHQALVFAKFTNKVPIVGYNSPFGSHKVEIVSQKELDETQK